MRVVVVSHHSRDDVAAFSGIPHHMFRALESAADVRGYVRLPPFDLQAALAGARSSRRQLQDIGATASSALRRLDADVVLCLGGAATPFLESRVPIVHWHDSTWHALLRMPTEDFAYRHPFLREWDERTIDRSALVAYAADWVRNDTLQAYEVDPVKVHVVPFGANVRSPTQAEVDRSLASRKTSPLRLAFVGVDWRRKGLLLAQLLTTRLNRYGLETELAVVGPVFGRLQSTGNWDGDGGELEAADIQSDPRVRLFGFIDKSSAAGRESYSELLARSHYVVHPAEFECFGVVLGEAAAHGLPVLALDAYGPRDVVRHGRTGLLFPRHQFVEQACAVILRHGDKPAEYREMAVAARQEYDARLNWASAVRRLLDLVGQHGLAPRLP